MNNNETNCSFKKLDSVSLNERQLVLLSLTCNKQYDPTVLCTEVKIELMYST